MPWIWTVPHSGDPFGPGMLLDAQSDFIGPIPTGSHFEFHLTGGDESTDSAFTYQFTTTTHFVGTMGYDYNLHHVSVNPPTRLAENGHSGTLIGNLIDDTGTVISTDSIPIVLDYTTGMPYIAYLTAEVDQNAHIGAVTDGLTATIQTASGAITRTLGQLFSESTLDRLTLTEITDGCTADRVTVDVGSDWIRGIIVRMCVIPDTYGIGSPDDEWRFADLAVLRIYRGTDLVKRVGIHTPNHMEYPLPQYSSLLATELFLETTPPDLNAIIDFAMGVTGRVYTMRLP